MEPYQNNKYELKQNILKHIKSKKFILKTAPSIKGNIGIPKYTK